MRPYQRIGLLGDIHSEDDSLEAALSYLKDAGVDRVLSVGDLADGRGSLDRTCQLLKGAQVTTVAGNHERWLLAGQMRDLPGAHRLADLKPQTVRYLRALPKMVEVQTSRGLALLCHGLGLSDMAAVRPDDSRSALASNSELQNILRDGSYRFVFNGHTHQRMLRHFGNTSIVNAGTFLRDKDPGFLLVDCEANRVLGLDFHAPTEIRIGWERELCPGE